MPFPIDMSLIRRTEEKLGRRLPLDYLVRITRENGGTVRTCDDRWNLFPIFDDSDRTRLKRTCNDIVRETKAARDWPGFPPDCLAIGDNGCGDKLVFLTEVAAPCYGDAVFWWNHETGELNHVADTFADL